MNNMETQSASQTAEPAKAPQGRDSVDRIVRVAPDGSLWRVIRNHGGEVFVEQWVGYLRRWDALGERGKPNWIKDFKTWDKGLRALRRRCPNRLI